MFVSKLAAAAAFVAVIGATNSHASPASEGAAHTSQGSGKHENTDAVHGKERSVTTGTLAECRPSSVNCPVGDSSGSSVITTDSLPIGSTGDRGNTISESDYPTSVGSGSMGSGATGSPAGPAPGPTNGIGR